MQGVLEIAPIDVVNKPHYHNIPRPITENVVGYVEGGFRPGIIGFGDNLAGLLKIDDDSVDLVVTDPPWNSLRKHNSVFVDDAGNHQSTHYDDTFNRESINGAEYHKFLQDLQLVTRFNPLYRYLTNIDGNNNEKLYCYLIYMSIRLIQIHRVLKPDGSMYLHCDKDAGHYLKQVMDFIFGYKNFRNDIIWVYGLGGSGNNNFSEKHDNLLFYTKSNKYYFNKPTEPAKSARMKGEYKGMIDVWDIPSLNNQAKERVGYPTQKPYRLYEIPIMASSKPGDLVLDPFAGSGTVPVLAHYFGRKFIAMDKNPDSVQKIAKRIDDLNRGDDIEIEKYTTSIADNINTAIVNQGKPEPVENITAGKNITDVYACQGVPHLNLLNKNDLRKTMWKEQHSLCFGCLFFFGDWSDLTTDHIVSTKRGGPDVYENKQLLCSSCNSMKGGDKNMAELWYKKLDEQLKLLANRKAIAVNGKCQKGHAKVIDNDPEKWHFVFTRITRPEKKNYYGKDSINFVDYRINHTS